MGCDFTAGEPFMHNDVGILVDAIVNMAGRACVEWMERAPVTLLKLSIIKPFFKPE